MKQPTTVREAGSMLKERLLDRRVEKLSRENDQLREELEELRHDLDAEHGRTKETLDALSKAKRPGRMKWLVLAGGAYVLGAKAGRARYEQMKGWMRSVARQDGERSEMTGSAATTGTPGGAAGSTGSGTTTRP
jgi:cell division septum initiation protein DivIVA